MNATNRPNADLFALTQFENAIKNFAPQKSFQTQSPSSTFATILTTLTRNLAGKQWRPLSYLWSKYETGFKEAKEGNLSSAEQIFSEAASLHNQFDCTPLLNPLIDVAALPAIAYLRYRQGRYQEAEKLLLTSIDNDAILLDEGLYILDYHRIQQLHNLARLGFRQGCRVEGAQLINSALRFLIYGDTPMLGAGGWSKQINELVPAQYRADMILQLTNEAVIQRLAHPEAGDRLFQIIFDNISTWQAQTETETHIQQWLKLNNLFSTDSFTSFLKSSTPFLTVPASDVDAYKLDTLMDIVKGLYQHNLYTDPSKKVIEGYIAKLRVGSKQKETCLLLMHQLRLNPPTTEGYDASPISVPE